MKRLILSTLMSLLLASALQAQNGTIRGTIIDGENAEPLYAANARLKGTNLGASSDFDGKFEVQAGAGTYELEISFIGLQSKTITGVVIKAGEVTDVGTIKLEPASSELGEVTITAEAVRNTEAAIITAKRKSANVIDGISAASFKKIGDGDAGEAVKRVPGVSVEGGKYVYVRGLGDRYTKTTLNGMDIPGLDPDRNSLQIDIFPTTLISNMTVLKTATADLPADFTGGIVNIETKEFPTKRVFSVNFGVGFNPQMHFNPDYLTYEGSSTDFLGFDGGERALPAAAETRGPVLSTDDDAAEFTQAFNPNLAAERQTSFMNYDFGVSLGNQYTLESGNKLGYIFSAKYQSNTRFYDNAIFGEFQNVASADVNELLIADSINGEIGEKSVLLAGLAGIAYKTQQSKYKFTVMHLQNGESRAADFFLFDNDGAVGNSGYTGVSDNLEYNQRSLTNILLAGEHHFDDSKWELEWKIAPTLSTLRDPDIRKTAFSINGTDTSFSSGEAGLPIRIWRFLDELNVANRVDLKRDYTLQDRDAKLKFGASYLFKNRNFNIKAFETKFTDINNQPDWNANPDNVLLDENIVPNGQVFISPQVSPDQNFNEYSASASNFGMYVSNEWRPFINLKAIVGLRAEYFVQDYEGVVRGNVDVPTDDQDRFQGTVLENFDLFPSANLIYNLNEDMNLRGSYYRSIARPSFKELSFANILDPVSNRTFNGGLFPVPPWDGDLQSAYINNMDVRWELFMDPGEIISVSGFYKTFSDAIELVRLPAAQTGNDYQPRNVGDGQLYGVELEIRKKLDFISPKLEKFNLSGNVTFVESFIQMTNAEFEGRKEFEKEGQSIDDRRDMAGQAPYIINAGLSYEDFKKGLNAGVYYNVKGPTLLFVGTGLIPDVYSEPFHNLKIKVNKSFGEEQRTTVEFEVANLLNDVQERFFRAYEAQDRIFTSLNPGVTFSLGVTYDIY